MFNWFASKSDYFNKQQLSHYSINLSGSSFQIGGGWDYLIERGQNSLETLSFQLSVNDSANFIDKSRIDINSQRLSVAKISYENTYNFDSGILTSSIGLNRGLSAFNAKTAGDFIDQNFLSLTANTNLIKIFYLNNRPYQYSSTLGGQYSNSNLPGTQSFSLTDDSIVRGLKENYISSNSGWYIRNNLSRRLYFNGFTVSPSIGFDYGELIQNNEKINAVGASLNVNFQFDKLSISTAISKGWLLDSYPSKRKESITAGISASYRF